ncbi:hypothetical protein AHMF7605_12015 [Adhaeribacter arboris]|uniref:YopX protein domain-containing protein n=1 Tax=Adhaeribacter arboris TaxID=2072846 RepID=A0A2T2YF98_9BACT|nr:hypothetical protein [Adhaeribacter arboris]PSR54196.1 hypothetical protein AHMF7605_12015 [Adhaeribacter arboris]
MPHQVQPVPGFFDPSGRQVFEGDVYHVDNAYDEDDEPFYHVCLWFQHLYRYGWVTVQKNFLERKYKEDEVILPPRLFNSSCTFLGNILLKPYQFEPLLTE